MRKSGISTIWVTFEEMRVSMQTAEYCAETYMHYLKVKQIRFYLSFFFFLFWDQILSSFDKFDC